MPNEQLVAYIKSQLAAGFSKDSISQALVGSGWQVTDINTAFAATEQDTNAPQTASGSRTWLIVGAVVILLLVAGGAFAAYYTFSAQPGPAPVTVATTTLPAASSTPLTLTEHATGSGTTTIATTTVGGVTVGATVGVTISGDTVGTVSCGSQDCFTKAFAACTPATLTTSIVGFAGVSYKIIGPANGGCKITFEYTTNPNPAWVDQPMTCTYNNKLDFQTALTNVFNAVLQKKSNDCVGPLVAVMQNVQ
jgi:hypothetical protein